jgi:hypothetical protein
MQDSVCANPIAGSGRNKPSKLMRNRLAVSAIPEVDVCLARVFFRPDRGFAAWKQMLQELVRKSRL